MKPDGRVAGSDRASLRLALRSATGAHLAELRKGLSDLRRAPAFERPHRRARLQRFLYGFGLPLRILRALFADPDARRAYLRVIAVQLAIVLAVGIPAVLLSRSMSDLLRGGIPHDFTRWAAIVSLILATLGTVEWCVVALSREHHDQLSRRASLLSGAPPEDEEAKPRIRVDVRWMWRKLKRRIRGMLVIGSGFPAIAILAAVPFVGRAIYPALAFVWTSYWMGVFAASKSAFAWRSEGVVGAPDPWFMRAAEHVSTAPVVRRLGVPRLYVRIWRRVSQGIFPPARELEIHGYELLGVAAFRVLLPIPGTYLFFRPLFPVAAAHILTTPRADDAPPALPTVVEDRLPLGANSSAEGAKTRSETPPSDGDELRADWP